MTDHPLDGIKVVRGSPDESELIALVASVSAMAATTDEDQEPGSPTSAWMDRSRTLRGHHARVLAKGPTAWRHSLR